MQHVIGVGVIGYGYWGPNLVRNFMEAAGSRVIAVSDLNSRRLELASRRYPAITATEDYRVLIQHPKVDLVAIATPVSTHFELAMGALRAGKHVLVEKPLARTSEEGLRLLEEAARRGLRVFVDHTFVYTGAVRRIRELVQAGELGDLYYYDSTRVNLGLFQPDVNVIWDLAVHDLAIMDYVLPIRPVAISAMGVSHVPGGPENIGYLTMLFEGSVIAHLSVNWLSPVKVRRTLIAGSRKMVVYDDMELSEKVKVYDRGITVQDSREAIYRMLVDYRMGDMWAPRLDSTEALKVEAHEIIAALETGAEFASDGYAGLQVVRILEAATKSMKCRGSMVELPSRSVSAA
jgi:predicted dehydrogenase